MNIYEQLKNELGIRLEQVEATVKLIDEGNTIPFIARYRKEVTGSLNDEVLRNLHERLVYLRNLEEKKEQVLGSIEEQGKLTDELKAQILAAATLVEVEDLYRPYRPKRRTRATIAKEKGLEPLAELIFTESLTKPAEEAGAEYVKEAEDAALSVKSAEVSEDGVTFLYGGDIKALLSAVNAMPITDMTITEPGLDEIFMHFYEKGGV